MACPSDRISRCTGYSYKEFEDTGLRMKALKLVEALQKAWEEGKDDIPEELLEDMSAMAGVGEDGKLGAAGLVHSKVLRFFYGLVEDWNMAIWLLRQTVRVLGGLPGYEEFLFMTNSEGSNGKGTWIALLSKTLGGSDPTSYFYTLDFSKHFVGMDAKGNNPEIAECEGRRFVSVNEAPDMTIHKRTLNVDLIKKLSVGSDNPITGMAKYKDPKLFNPQMLLAFFAQDAPEFPKKDGGLRSRLSYLLMPFEFVADCKLPHHRPLDISIKTGVEHLIPELLMWAAMLTPGLQAQKSRVILPRPAKVQEDTAAQYMATSDDAEPVDKKGVAIAYADTRLCEWKPEMGLPATRAQINEHFKRQQGHTNLNSREVLATILRDQHAGAKGAPFKQRVSGHPDVAVYKASFVDGQLGTSGFELKALRTVTLHHPKETSQEGIEG